MLNRAHQFNGSRFHGVAALRKVVKLSGQEARCDIRQFWALLLLHCLPDVWTRASCLNSLSLLSFLVCKMGMKMQSASWSRLGCSVKWLTGGALYHHRIQGGQLASFHLLYKHLFVIVIVLFHFLDFFFNLLAYSWLITIVSFRCSAKWLGYTYTHTHSFSHSFPI